MSILSLSSSKCVLLLTDDALCVYKVSSRNVALVDSFGWRIPDFEMHVSSCLNREVGSGSVYILNDTVEQHYRKEKIARLTAVDRQNIINRRLNIAFPSYPTRAAIELKEKKKTPDPEKLFLFAAVPSTDSLRKLFEAIKQSNCTVSSYCLLPVESVDLVDKIATKIAKDNGTPRAGWSILVGQHNSGGFRQVVTRNGQIALTRITPVIIPEMENGAQWATDVIQEIQSTISYLARFGYSPEDGLDIMLVSRPDLGSLVESMINVPCNFTSMTVQRAAEIASLNIGKDQDPHFAEALHLAWYVKKPRAVMSMKSREMDTVANPRKAAFFVMLLMTAGLGYLSYNLSNEYKALYAAEANLVEVEKMKVLANQMYDEELKRKESLGIDIKLIQGALSISQEYDRLSFDPLPVLEAVGKNLRELRVDTIVMEQADIAAAPGQVDASGNPTAGGKQVSLKLNFTFPGTIRPQDGNEQISALSKRLASALPGYKVGVSKQLADLTYTGQITNETGFDATKRKAEEVYTGEILIQKDIVNAPGAGTQ